MQLTKTTEPEPTHAVVLFLSTEARPDTEGELMVAATNGHVQYLAIGEGEDAAQTVIGSRNLDGFQMSDDLEARFVALYEELQDEVIAAFVAPEKGKVIAREGKFWRDMTSKEAEAVAKARETPAEAKQEAAVASR